MDNAKIAQQLDNLASLLEFQGANPFRLKAYRTGAQVIRDSAQSIADAVASHEDLTAWVGVGKSVAQKCIELVQTGTMQQLVEIQKEVPPTVLDLLRVPNLGPKKAAVLFKELQIENLEQLKRACQQNEVQKLKGFAAKTQQAILDGIAIAEQANQRMRWDQADQVVDALRMHLQDVPMLKRLEFAGSYRRGKETVGDIDILVVSDDHTIVMDRLGSFPDLASTIVRGGTKMSIRLENGFQVDLRVVPEISFGAALQYFTGSQTHNVELRHRAKQQNLKINEWGVFQIGSPAELENNPSLDGWVAGKEEQDVYQSVSLPWIDPHLRENREEFAWADADQLPKLLELEDIRGDLHMHSTATDGKNTIREMIQAAQALGLQYIAITDHSQRVAVAGGLDETRLLKQWKEIDILNAELGTQFTVLKSIECDIRENGDMDLSDDVLAEADWVMASVHFGIKQSRQEITDRILGAIEHPSVSAISHPTGRLLNRRPAYEVDMAAVISHAKKYGKFLELNASSKRLDLNDIHLSHARQAGVRIVISTDAHSTDGLASMRYGIIQARRAGLTQQHVVNTRSWPEIKAMIGVPS